MADVSVLVAVLAVAVAIVGAAPPSSLPRVLAMDSALVVIVVDVVWLVIVLFFCAAGI